MIERLIKNLSHPKYAFLYIKDKFWRVFFYLIILATIMTLPVFINASINKTNLLPEQKTFSTVLTNLIDKDIKIVDGKLEVPTEGNFVGGSGMFFVSVKKYEYLNPGYYLVFEDEAATIYLNAGNGLIVKSNSYDYDDLNISNIEFTSENKNKLSNIVIKTFTNNSQIITTLIMSSFFINYFDLLLVILIMTLFANAFIKLPLNFKSHFKINTYIATIYAVLSLLLTLFGLEELNFIALIITYFFHQRAYRSIKIIGRVEVKNKDE